MAGSSGGSNNMGKGVFSLILLIFGVGLFVFGLFRKELFVVLFGVCCLAVAVAFGTIRVTDSPKNDEQRRADAESSQLKNMDPAPSRPTLRSGKRNWAKYMLTHGEPIPGPADQHVPHDEYHHLATDPRYRGEAFTEDGPHMLDIRRRERGEDQDS